MAMYNNYTYQTQTVDEATVLENNFSKKIDEIHNLLDSSASYNLNDMGREFDVHFSFTKDNHMQYYINPCINSREYDLHSSKSYSNASSSSSSCTHVLSNRFARNNGNYKKYPLRSDKLFNVVPNLVDMRISTEDISLKALSIGPDFYYKSNSHTIIDKIKTTANYLQILSTDRNLLEILVNKYNKNYELPLFEPKRFIFNEAYNIKMYYHHSMNLLESEYLLLSKISTLLSLMFRTVLPDFTTDTKILKVTIREESDFREILNDFLIAINNLKKLNNLGIIKSDNFSQNIADDEKELLLAAFDDMTFAIRQWHIMLWTIKEGISMINIKSNEQIQHFRNLFIGS